MLVIFIFLLGLLFLLLWLPIVVEIDTEHQIYRAEWQGIAAFWTIPEVEQWRWFFRLFFWEQEWNPKRKSMKKERKSATPKSTTAKSKRTFSVKRRIVLFHRLLKAITIERVKINWDTNDFILNAWLWPVFYLIGGNHKQISINFSGKQALAIRLQTRFGLLLIAIIRAFFSPEK